MEKEKSLDAKFVKGLFLTLAWIFSTGPLIYAIYTHEWLFLALILAAEAGVAVNIGIKDL